MCDTLTQPNTFSHAKMTQKERKRERDETKKNKQIINIFLLC